MVNQITLVGRLGKDPLLKTFSDISAIAEFPLATTEQYKDKEGKWVEVTDWHNIKMPTKYLADRAVKSLKKGSLVYLQGKSKTRSYDDKDGVKKYITEVVVETMRLMDKKDASSTEEHKPASQPESHTNTPHNEQSNNTANNSSSYVSEDDLPF